MSALFWLQQRFGDNVEDETDSPQRTSAEKHAVVSQSLKLRGRVLTTLLM